jgi:septal ring factor EnvC (AmiA/AmiB activator)
MMCVLLYGYLLLQLQKLVSTQECLQQQLAAQVDSSTTKAEVQQQQLQRVTAELQDSQQRLEEAQAAAKAAASQLQVCMCGAGFAVRLLLLPLLADLVGSCL